MGRLYASRLGWATWLVLLFIAAAVVRLVCYTGLIGSDDLWYVRYAEQIVAGNFSPHSNQYAGRFGLILTVAGVFEFFGVSVATTVLVPLLASSASVPLLAAIGARLYGPLAGSIAALLLSTSPIHLRFATILVPEPVMEFWVLVAIWCYLEATRRRSWWLGTIAGAAVGVAYLNKEPAAFIAPALIAAAWFTGRRSLAVAVAVGALAIAVVETLTYAVVLNDPFHRIKSAAVGTPTPLGMGRGDVVDVSSGLARRLFVDYPRSMIYPTLDFGLHFVISLILTGLAVLALRRERLLLLLWAALPWLFLNFGSASLTHYTPIYASERYLSPTLPPLFLLAAGLVAMPGSTYTRARALGFLLLAIVGAVGIACGLSVRGHGFRVDQIAVLRSIVRAARASVVCHVPGDCGHVISFGDYRVDAWSEALHILDRRGVATSSNSDLVVVEDTLGLPSVHPGSCPAGTSGTPGQVGDNR
jgi:4-amino-4-deoxy-L-arabinose transferase-like glycosyltransferase